MTVLNRDEIKNLYESGLSKATIAQIYRVSNSTIHNFMKNNGIQSRTLSQATTLYNKNNINYISNSQKQLILGSLLGDSSLSFVLNKKNYTEYRFQTNHCELQKDYLIHKANILNCKYYNYIYKENSSSFSKAGNKYYTMCYCNKYELEKIYSLTHYLSKKVVSNKWLNELTEEAIAYWFMDDGSSSITRLNNNGSIRDLNVSLNTQGFSEEENIILINFLLNKFSISSTLSRKKYDSGIKFFIRIKSSSVNNFMNLIEPYIVDCMKYKIKNILLLIFIEIIFLTFNF